MLDVTVSVLFKKLCENKSNFVTSEVNRHFWTSFSDNPTYRPLQFFDSIDLFFISDLLKRLKLLEQRWSLKPLKTWPESSLKRHQLMILHSHCCELLSLYSCTFLFFPSLSFCIFQFIYFLKSFLTARLIFQATIEKGASSRTHAGTISLSLSLSLELHIALTPVLWHALLFLITQTRTAWLSHSK